LICVKGFVHQTVCSGAGKMLPLQIRQLYQQMRRYSSENDIGINEVFDSDAVLLHFCHRVAGRGIFYFK
jgi:hypothetical protein